MQRMHNPEREAKKADRISRSKTFKPRIASTDYESFMFKCRLCMMGFRRRGMLVSLCVLELLLQLLHSTLMNSLRNKDGIVMLEHKDAVKPGEFCR